MEILAPAGDRQSLEAAVKSGADAVYFGAADFNARRNADNFTKEEFREAVLYCRKNGVKSHIVLNTLLKDQEIPSALETAVFAAQSGADAFIVQDAGLALLLKKKLPQIPLHASTQMTVHSRDGLLYAKNMGFDRVVLSRELSLKEIESLCQDAKEIGIELEVFIHGALCMSMSGQCFMSSMIGGRSGNRGLCAQPCRLPFKTPEGYEYSLSLKDMSHLGEMCRLSQLGVASFKIEGRMKDAEYVAAAVTAARMSRDTGAVSDQMNALLCSAFSRSGFCDGYLTGKRQDMFGVRTEKDANLSKEVQNSIHEFYRREYQRIPVDMALYCKKGAPALLKANDGSFEVSVEGDKVQYGTERPLNKELAFEKLSKLGGTPYILNSLELTADEDAFLPISSINDLKKRAVFALSELRCKISDTVINDDIPRPDGHVYSDTLIRARFNGVLPEDLSGISRAYLTHSSDDKLFKKLIEKGIETGVELPRALFGSSDALKERLIHLKNMGVNYALCEGFAQLTLAKELGFECDAGMFSQIMNSYSCLSAEYQGASSVTVSFECTVEQINSLASPLPIGYVGYGYLPLMMTRCCPLRNSRSCKECSGGYLTDRKDMQFFVKCRDGVSEVFNCVPLEMCNKQSQFSADFVLLYFTFEDEQEIREEIEDWLNRKTDREEFTHGLYYRGVQ